MPEVTHAELLVRLENVNDSVEEIKEDIKDVRRELAQVNLRLTEAEKFNSLVSGMSRGGRWVLGTVIALVMMGLATATFFGRV